LKPSIHSLPQFREGGGTWKQSDQGEKESLEGERRVEFRTQKDEQKSVRFSLHPVRASVRTTQTTRV